MFFVFSCPEYQRSCIKPAASIQAALDKTGQWTAEEVKRVAVNWTSEHQKNANSCGNALERHLEQMQKDLSSQVKFDPGGRGRASLSTNAMCLAWPREVVEPHCESFLTLFPFFAPVAHPLSG